MVRYADLAESWNLRALLRERRSFGGLHDRPFPMAGRAIAARMFPGPYSQFARVRGQRSVVTAPDSPDAAGWWNRDWMEAFRDERAADPPPGRDGLTRRLYADAMQGELQELLRFADRNSMAWSREVRQPYLDHRLAEPRIRAASGTQDCRRRIESRAAPRRSHARSERHREPA